MACKHPLADCEHCPLYEYPMVPSYIPAQPVLGIIGDHPVKDELNTGKPLTGVPGQLMQRSLAQVGMNDYTRVYRSNVVLCAPSYVDGVPQGAIRACAPRLEAELAALPSIPLVTLGAMAAEALDALQGLVCDEGITARAGKRYPLQDRSYTTMLHPAYILRNPNLIRTFVAQLGKAIAPEEKPRNWLATQRLVVTADNWPKVASYLSALPDNTRIAFDIETSYLQWYDTYERSASKTLCLVLTDRVDRAIIIPAIFLTFQPVKAVLAKFFDRMYTVAHNGKFDQIGLKRHGIEIRLDYDTLLASFTLNELKGYHGLKYLSTALMGMPDYERLLLGAAFVDLPSEKKDYSTLPPEKLYHYAAIDVCATLALSYKLEAMMIDDDTIGAFDVLMRGSVAVASAEYNGIMIDRSYLEALQEILAEDLARITIDMYEQVQGDSLRLAMPWPVLCTSYKVPREITAPNTKDTATSKAFNVGSTDQMAYLIYEHYKLKHMVPLGYKTKPTSTNDEALKALEVHPFVSLLKEYRRIAKIQSSYVNKLLVLADTQDRVHVNFNLNGTETGRLSADEGMHGIPRPEDKYGMAIRGAFIAPQGSVLVIGDYSQAELRVMAAEANEPFLLNAFNMPNEQRHAIAREMYTHLYDSGSDKVRNALAKLATDVHSRTAAYLFDEYESNELQAIIEGNSGAAAVAKKLRTFGKNFNFGDIYQGGAAGIWAMVQGKIPLDRVQVLLAEKHKLTPRVTQYARDQFRLAKKQGYVSTRMGKKRRFPLLTYDVIDEVRKASVNMPVQGGASDLTVLAAHRLVCEGYKVLHLIHDSIICEALTHEATDCAQAMRRAMVEVGNEYYPEVAWDIEIENEDNGYSRRWYEKRPNLRTWVQA